MAHRFPITHFWFPIFGHVYLAKRPRNVKCVCAHRWEADVRDLRREQRLLIWLIEESRLGENSAEWMCAQTAEAENADVRPAECICECEYPRVRVSAVTWGSVRQGPVDAWPCFYGLRVGIRICISASSVHRITWMYAIYPPPAVDSASHKHFYAQFAGASLIIALH